MKQKGFTLIEMMIVAAIVGILAAVFIPAYKQHEAKQQGTYMHGGAWGDSSQAVGSPSATTPCVAGYVVLGNKQMLDEHGNGIKCN